MEFHKTRLDDFKVIGISARVDMDTAAELIGGLWQRWFSEGLQGKIANKVSDDVFNIYTDYQGDHTEPYTCFLGCRVNAFSDVPEGMEARELSGGNYAVFDLHGKLPDVVVETWQTIYGLDGIERRFGVDFDVYGEEAGNPEDARLKTYVSIRG